MSTLSFKQRLKLSSEAVSLLEIIGDTSYPLESRIKASRKRIDILNQLSSKEVSLSEREDLQVSAVTDKGRAILGSFGATIDPKLKGEVADAILSNQRINDLIAAQKWSGPKKARVLASIAEQPRSYDVYRIVGGDKAQSGDNHTFNIYEEVRDIHNEHYIKAGEALQDAVLGLINRSPVSGKDADITAAQSGFDKLAENRLTRQRKGDFTGRGGLAKRKLVDAASGLYQMIAFTGEPINFTVRKARQDYRNTDRTISVGEGFTKKVLWHELAHSIEYDHPEVLEMSKNFLRKRLESSNGVRSLREIYQDKWGGKKGVKYSDNEYTIDDGAFTPYATKFYNHSNPFDLSGATATEVLTMGIESLVDDHSRGQLAVNDPEHFEFIVGVVAYLQDKAGAKK